MFEKDAEEYVKKDGTKAEQILNALNEISPLKITLKQLPFILAMIQQTFQDGAEIGYNKANEWHYVKDKDYPKDNKPVLCILGDIDLDNCEVGYYNDVGSGEPWYFETYHLPDDDGDNAWGVSAWKEIVLPEEIEK